MERRKVSAVIFGTLIASLLLRMADLLMDVHCDSDNDCSRPRVCRFVCRRNCKSVCVLLASEKEMLALSNRRQLAAPKKGRKIGGHRRKPTDRSTEDEAPFLAGQNPFVLAKMREEITPLTISEAELEAELGQNGGAPKEENEETPKGPSDFVTAPTANNLEEMMTGTTATQLAASSSSSSSSLTPPPFETRNFRETMTSQKAGTITEVRGRGRSPSPHLMTLSTSMELLQRQGEDGDKAGTTAARKSSSSSTTNKSTTETIMTTKVVEEDREPPGISPQPPGFTPIPKSSSSTTATKRKGTSTAKTSEKTESISETKGGAEEGEEKLDNERTKEKKPKIEKHYSGEKSETKGAKSGGEEDELGSGKKGTKFWPPLKLATTPSGDTTQKTAKKTTTELQQQQQQETTTLRTTKRNCPNPPVCLRNCGIVIDEDGCQSCQCLWISKACDTDLDCAFAEGQFCDLGRCECADGWEQNEGMSGICRKKEESAAKLRGVPNLQGPDQSDQLRTASASRPAAAAEHPSSSDQLAFPLSTYPTTVFSDSDIFSPSILGPDNGQMLKLPFHHRLFVPNLGPKLRQKRQMLAEKDENRPCESGGQCLPNASAEGKMPNFAAQLPIPIVPINQSPKQTQLLFPHFYDDITAQEKNFPTEMPVDYDDSDEEENNLMDNGTKIDETATAKQMPTTGGVPMPTTALIQTVQTLHFVTEEPSQIDGIKEAQQQEKKEPKTALLFVPKAEENQTEQKDEKKAAIGAEQHEQKQRESGGSTSAQTAEEEANEQQQRQAGPATQPPVEETEQIHRISATRPEVEEVQQQQQPPAQLTPSQSFEETIETATQPQLVQAIHVTPSTTPQFQAVTALSTETTESSKLEQAVHSPLTAAAAEEQPSAPYVNKAVHPPSATPPFQAVHPPSATPPTIRTKSKHFRTLRPFSIPQQKKGLQKIPFHEADDGGVHLGLTALRGTDLRHHPLRQTLPWEETKRQKAIVPPNERTIGPIGPTKMAQIVEEAEENANGWGNEIIHGWRIYLDYTRRNRISRPIRVEHKNSKELIKDECVQSRDCGRRQFLCCAKRWCDLSGDCGMAKFCLPSCDMTKLAHLSELSPEGRPRIDLLYD